MAEASFKTVIDSMSLGLIVLSGLRGSAASKPMLGPLATVCSFWSGTPSTTYSGSLLALIDVPPRTRICTPPPGSPLFVTICTPVTRPWTSWFAFVMTPLLASSALTCATDPVIASRRWLP